MRGELERDAEAFGDPRRSPIVERVAAKAMDETVLVPTEPVTVVLSEKGWVRSARGHEVDPRELSYKAGDGFLLAVKGKSNQLAVFLDSTGRAYALPVHGLPSARGQGEPLSSHLTPPPGASFLSVLLGQEDDLYLLATSAGYGFIAKLGDLMARNRAGKAVIHLTEGASLLPPVLIPDGGALLAAATDAGRLLVFPLKDLPQMPRGKGVKILNIPAAKAGEESLAALCPVADHDTLTVYSGKRFYRLKPADLAEFRGNRAQRGSLLPSGFRHVAGLAVEGQAAAVPPS